MYRNYGLANHMTIFAQAFEFSVPHLDQSIILDPSQDKDRMVLSACSNWK
jgi:hypothetical protein